MNHHFYQQKLILSQLSVTNVTYSRSSKRYNVLEIREKEGPTEDRVLNEKAICYLGSHASYDADCNTGLRK